MPTHTGRMLVSAVTMVTAILCSGAEPNVWPAEVFIVPNLHPASCGWLTDWSTERNYCANDYLDHLDRVRDDPNYAFALSECNNMIAILNFHPDRVAELKQRIREGRVELVNAFFLEPTINLSGGEALVKMGIEGLRWQQQVFGVRPRFAWTIDVTGVHEQMGQIVSGLGLDALVYTRDNPTSRTMHRLEAPDGSRCLALSPGPYADWGPLFSTQVPLDSDAILKLLQEARAKAGHTPAGAPVLVLGGSGDYSLAPRCATYPSGFLAQGKQVTPQTKLRFSGLSAYVDTVLPGIRSGRIELPVSRRGARMSWTSFWIQNPRVKTWYRRAEHELQAAEILATAASLNTDFNYPAQALYHAWLQMLLNMDRNTLWGAAGGMVFEHEKSWDVRDRFESVEAIAFEAANAALRRIAGEGACIGLFNPLNWPRTDPVLVHLPVGTSLANAVCQTEADGRVLCRAELPSTGVRTLEKTAEAPPAPQPIDLPAVIETTYYRARVDPNTGALCSLRLRSSDREMLAGSVLLVAEQAGDFHNTPGRDQRKRLADSGQFPAHITVADGPLATVVHVESTFFGGRSRQTLHFYKSYPRVDFDTELNDIPDKTVVLAEFPLARPILETRRGIPYGFSHGAWAAKNANLAGFADGIVPAIRWSHYQFDRGGVALLDRGLPGRELTGQTPVLFLFNAQELYMGYPCAWLSGRGGHHFSYALVAHDGDWRAARIPQMAWEFNCPPTAVAGVAKAAPKSFVRTSGNVVVEALRCEGNEMELRLAECLGVAGPAEVTLNLPHREAALTDLVGGRREPLTGGSPYRFAVRPQQIVTLRCRTDSAVADVQPLVNWEPLVPPTKRATLQTKLNKKGHPPAGGQAGGTPPELPADAATSVARGKPATASNIYHNQADCVPELAFDGDPGTRWASDAGLKQGWLAVDLGRPCTIDRAFLSEAYDRIEQFELQAQREGQWKTFARGRKVGSGLELKFDPVTAREVRLNVLQAADGPTIWEFLLFETAQADPYDETALAADPTLHRPVVVYSRDQAPATPRLEDLPLRESVSQYGITWTFEQPARIGQFVNGDWYVVGPVTVKLSDPRPLYGSEIPNYQLDRMDKERPEAQRVRNGFMLNPPAQMKVAYDSGVRNWFDPALVQKLPVTMKPGDSLVSTSSMPEGLVLQAQLRNKIERGEGDSSPIRTAAVLTCVSEPQPPDAFRPAFCEREHRVYLARNLKRELLPTAAATQSIPRIEQYVRFTQRPWVGTGFFGFEEPVENMPQYGLEYGRVVGITALLLCTDLKPEQKELLLVNFVQIGIDLGGMVRAGHPGWTGWGGHGSGRKLPIVFAGLLLGDDELAGIGGSYPKVSFGEDEQTAYGACWTGAKVVFAGHSGIEAATGEGRSRGNGWGPYEHTPPAQWKDGANTSESYRRCCTSVGWVAQALTLRLLHAERAWNHDAFFDYVDRWMGEDDAAFVKAIKEATGRDHDKEWARQGQAWDAFVNEMWAKHRPTLPAPADGWKQPHDDTYYRMAISRDE